MAGHAKRLSVGWAVFGAAAPVSIVVILIGSRDTVLTGDELGILSRVADQSLGHALFEPPPSKYLIAFPTLVYGGIAGVFGAGSYLPYRILGVALVVLAAALLFALARRRAPEPLALGCAILLLFFGAAGEVVAIPARVPGQIAVCAGLGMLLALDTRDRRDDALACALGVVAVISHPVGLAFVGAAGIVVVFGRERGWRTVWVAAVPLAVYALWWLTLRTPAGDDVPLTIGDAYTFARDAFTAVCAALTGIFRSPWVDDGHFITTASRVLALLAVLGAVVAVVRARRVWPASSRRSPRSRSRWSGRSSPPAESPSASAPRTPRATCTRARSWPCWCSSSWSRSVAGARANRSGPRRRAVAGRWPSPRSPRRCS